MPKSPQSALSAPAPDRLGETRPADRIEITVNGVRIEVSPALEAAVNRALQGASQPLPREMTTTQAADFLDVSRPFVIKLVTRGELPCRLVGRHRRIPTPALVEYRERMFHQACQAADEMTRLTEEMDLPADHRPSKAQ